MSKPKDIEILFTPEVSNLETEYSNMRCQIDCRN